MQRKGKNKRFFRGMPTVIPMDPSAAAFPMPRVVIPMSVLNKIFRYAAVADDEIGGIGFLEERGEELYISEAFLLPQKASEVEMVLDDMALNVFVGDCDTPELIRMQWHSHGFGSVFFSAQDVGTIAKYDMPYAVSIVVNKNFDIRCRIDIFKPIYVCLEAVVFVELSKEGDPSLDAVREEVAQTVKNVSVFKKRVSIRSSNRMIVPLGEASSIARMIGEGGML